MPTQDELMQALKDVYDPEIPINIVDLGLIHSLKETEGSITVKMTLTTPGCPMAASLAQDVKARLLEVEGVERVQVDLVWDPPWTPERINRSALENLFGQLSSSSNPPSAP